MELLFYLLIYESKEIQSKVTSIINASYKSFSWNISWGTFFCFFDGSQWDYLILEVHAKFNNSHIARKHTKVRIMHKSAMLESNKVIDEYNTEWHYWSSFLIFIVNLMQICFNYFATFYKLSTQIKLSLLFVLLTLNTLSSLIYQLTHWTPKLPSYRNQSIDLQGKWWQLWRLIN